MLQDDQPAFVALHYQALSDEAEGARLAASAASLADLEAGRVKFGSPGELLEELLG